MVTIIADSEKELLSFLKKNLDCPKNVTYSKCDKYMDKRACNLCILENETRFNFEIRNKSI